MNTISSRLKKLLHRQKTEPQPTSTTTDSIAETTNFGSGKPDEPIINETLTGTPFRIVYLPSHGWFIALGMERISEKFYKTRAEAIKPVQDRDYNFLYNFIITSYLAVEKFQNETAKQ